MRVSQPTQATGQQVQRRPAYGAAAVTLAGHVRRTTRGQLHILRETHGTYRTA
jgi:hypothetical protein